MTNKRQVMVALFAREGHFFSQGSQGKREFDHNDFLWSIIIRPKKSNGHDNECFDIRHVSARPVRRDQPKPTGYWQFRKITQYEPVKDPRLLGQFMIGKVPHEVNYDHLVELLETVRLPRREGEFHENGVHWIRAAIVRLQMSGLGEEFDVDGFLDHARDQAQAMAFSNTERGPFLINYTDRPM